MIKITLKDGSVREYNERDYNQRSGGKYKCGACEGCPCRRGEREVKDLSYPLENDALLTC